MDVDGDEDVEGDGEVEGDGCEGVEACMKAEELSCVGAYSSTLL